MKQWKSVDELRRDFSDLNRRLGDYKGDKNTNHISDPKLATDLRDFGQNINQFVGTSTPPGSSSERSTESRADG